MTLNDKLERERGRRRRWKNKFNELVSLIIKWSSIAGMRHRKVDLSNGISINLNPLRVYLFFFFWIIRNFSHQSLIFHFCAANDRRNATNPSENEFFLSHNQNQNTLKVHLKFLLFSGSESQRIPFLSPR